MTFPCCWLLLGSLAAPPALVLVQDGVPAAHLLLPEQPSSAAQLAAFELRRHVQLITGATLPIVRDPEPGAGVAISVGPTRMARGAVLDAAQLGPQEYVVRSAPGALYLLGRDDPDPAEVVCDPDAGRYENLPGFWESHGTLLAAYDFLERCCGVRWLNQTDYGTAHPQTRTLRVAGIDLRRSPGFAYRDAIGATGDNPAMYDAYVELWAASAPEYEAWEQAAHAELHRRFPDPGRYETARRGEAQLFLLRSRNGGEVQRCNHSLYGYYERFWRDPATRRPGMFAQGYEGEPPQMCYTSRELIEQVAQDAGEYYDGRKTGADLRIFWQPRLPNLFPVEPMDNGSFCKCAACRAWLHTGATPGFSTAAHSDYFFNFVNEVAKALHRTHPDRGLVALAYASHAGLPGRVKLDPTVAVQFCFASNRGGLATPEYQHELGLVRAWAAEAQQSHRPLYLWLYDTFPVETARNANLHCWPGFFAHAAADQLRLFARLGYRGMFHCGYGQEVEAYVTFKLMDDPTRRADDLLDDYFTGLYGAAARPLRRLYEAIEKTHAGKAPGYTRERMAQLEKLLAEARGRARTDGERTNLDLFEKGVWSYMAAGLEQRERIRATSIPAVRVPRLAEAGGDAEKLEWDRAAPLPGPWYRNNSDRPADHKLSGRIAHDGRHLYLELVDACETKGLTTSPMVFPLDDWEVFVAAQRGLPYRQYASGPSGLTVALSHGEVNFRTNVPIDNAPFKATSDATAPDRWVTRLVWPLDGILPGGVKPGGKLFLNIVRVWAIPGGRPDGSGIDAWGPFTKVHDVSRLPELDLE